MQNSLRFNGALPLTLNNWARCNTTSIARPRYSYTSRCAVGALTHSRDRINIQFPTSHYNSIKANLLLPLEHCFGWMLSGAPTPLWAQLRTFKHIKISQALHCPDYCLNIICFYILPLPLWLIFPLKLYPSVIFSPLLPSRVDTGSGKEVASSTYHAKIASCRAQREWTTPVWHSTGRPLEGHWLMQNLLCFCTIICVSNPGVGKLRPEGHMRPSKLFNPAQRTWRKYINRK